MLDRRNAELLESRVRIWKGFVGEAKTLDRRRGGCVLKAELPHAVPELVPKGRGSGYRVAA